nr:hypothetical protein [Tanacetum cinerariifolium]
MTEGKGPEDPTQETVAPEIPLLRNMPAAGAASVVKEEEEVATLKPRSSKKHGRRGSNGADANAPPKVLRKDYASTRPEQSTRGGKSLPMMRTAATPGVKHDPVLQDFERRCGYHGSARHALCEKCMVGESTSSSSMVGSPGEIYQPGWGVTNSCCLDTPEACQVTMGSQLRLRFKQEVRLLKKAKAQIARRDQRIQVKEEEIKKLDQEIQGLQNQTSNLKTLLEAETDMKKAAETKNIDLTKELESLQQIKAAFEEFKKYKDDRVEKRCVEIDARLDALSIDFDEELYPHMLTAIAGMSKGLAHGIEHGKASRVDQLESLKDAPIEVIMASLYLESDFKEDAPKWIRDLRPSTSQLKIRVYPDKKKCQVVCHTHGIGFAHHARSDGIPVSVPTVAPQGLAILLADAATQTKTSKDDASPRLLRSKSLPPLYNLDWP